MPDRDTSIETCTGGCWASVMVGGVPGVIGSKYAGMQGHSRVGGGRQGMWRRGTTGQGRVSRKAVEGGGW